MGLQACEVIAQGPCDSTWLSGLHLPPHSYPGVNFRPDQVQPRRHGPLQKPKLPRDRPCGRSPCSPEWLTVLLLCLYLLFANILLLNLLIAMFK